MVFVLVPTTCKLSYPLPVKFGVFPTHFMKWLRMWCVSWTGLASQSCFGTVIRVWILSSSRISVWNKRFASSLVLSLYTEKTIWLFFLLFRLPMNDQNKQLPDIEIVLRWRAFWYTILKLLNSLFCSRNFHPAFSFRGVAMHRINSEKVTVRRRGWVDDDIETFLRPTILHRH